MGGYSNVVGIPKLSGDSASNLILSGGSNDNLLDSLLYLCIGHLVVGLNSCLSHLRLPLWSARMAAVHPAVAGQKATIRVNISYINVLMINSRWLKV